MSGRPETFGKYRVVERLGAGGMAEVYKCRLEGLGGFEELMAKEPHFASLFTNALPVDVVEPSDISEAVLFLASDAGRFTTGHNLHIDMGNILR